jgi:hypothetical protein
MMRVKDIIIALAIAGFFALIGFIAIDTILSYLAPLIRASPIGLLIELGVSVGVFIILLIYLLYQLRGREAYEDLARQAIEEEAEKYVESNSN